MTKPDGLIAVGEPFWLKEPTEECLKASKTEREAFGTHYENVRLGEEELIRIYTLVSNHDDLDHCDTFQWRAVDDYVRANPDDPDNPELLEKSSPIKEKYLRWSRETLGWAIYIFRNSRYNAFLGEEIEPTYK